MRRGLFDHGTRRGSHATGRGSTRDADQHESPDLVTRRGSARFAFHGTRINADHLLRDADQRGSPSTGRGSTRITFYGRGSTRITFSGARINADHLTRLMRRGPGRSAHTRRGRVARRSSGCAARRPPGRHRRACISLVSFPSSAQSVQTCLVGTDPRCAAVACREIRGPRPVACREEIRVNPRPVVSPEEIRVNPRPLISPEQIRVNPRPVACREGGRR